MQIIDSHQNTGLETDKSVKDMVQSGQLRWMTNFHVDEHGNHGEGTVRYIDSLREQYGSDAVVVAEAMSSSDFEITGAPSGVPDYKAVYVNSESLAANPPRI